MPRTQPACRLSQPSTEYAEYRNDRWPYSLAVPADMIVSEHEREGGGHTTQFMGPTATRNC